MSIPVQAPLRSITALVIRVVPCTTSDTCAISTDSRSSSVATPSITARDGIVLCRELFKNVQCAGLSLEQREVGEGTADINPETISH